MPTDSEWPEIITRAYQEISPRDDPDGVEVGEIIIESETECRASVNGVGSAGMVDGHAVAEVDGKGIYIREVESGELNPGIGFQSVKVSISE